MGPALLTIAVTWCVLSLLFAGIGLLIIRLIGCRLSSTVALLPCVWVGWGFTLCCLQFLHFFYAVNPTTFVLLIAMSLAGWFWNGTDLISRFRNAKGFVAPAGLLFLTAFLLAVHAMHQPGNYDSGLYHVTLINWCSTYPVVPGLGNLHDRLAFNCSYFLYPALLNAGPFLNEYHHLASGLLFLWALSKSLIAWRRLIGANRATTASDLLDALFLVPILSPAIRLEFISSPTPDVAVFILGFVVGSELLKLTSLKPDPSRPETMNPFLLCVFNIIFVSTIGVIVKLNFAVFGVLAIVFAIASILQNGRHKRFLIITCIILAFAVACWLMRGILLSGYPAFPSTFGAVNVDWKIPPELAQHLKILSAWARHPGPDWKSALHGWSWFPQWAIEILRDPEVTLPLGMLIGGIAFLAAVWREDRSSLSSSQILLLVIPICATIAWFFAAPNPRFLGSMLWLLSGSAVALALVRRPRSVFLPVLIVCTALLFAARINIYELFRPLPPDSRPLKTANVVLKTTLSGLRVYVPAQMERMQCWNAPLPCTPYFNPALSLREEGNLAKGFRIHK